MKFVTMQRTIHRSPSAPTDDSATYAPPPSRHNLSPSLCPPPPKPHPCPATSREIRRTSMEVAPATMARRGQLEAPDPGANSRSPASRILSHIVLVLQDNIKWNADALCNVNIGCRRISEQIVHLMLNAANGDTQIARSN